MGGTGLEIRLVGTIDAARDGETVALPGARVRCLLAMLALSAGRPVSLDALARGIWDEEPPENVRASLQTYVGRLRRALGSAAVRTVAAGYVLDIPRDHVDLLAYADETDAAHLLTEPEQARAHLAAVLQRWDGEPFGDAPSDWIGRQEAPQWHERRLRAFERWVDLCLDAGEHAVCLIELNHQVERHPLREPLWARLLRALGRAGRTAEALDRYEAVRQRLAEELGVDPSPELRGVHADLLATSDAPVSVAKPRTVPRQLPVPLRGFVGRQAHLDRLDELRAHADVDSAPVVVALHGAAGSGKSTLAVHWAHRVKAEFPDGQLHVNLHGYGPRDALKPEEALQVLLRGIGIDGADIPFDVDEAAGLLRTELDGRRLLIVLDNARDSAQVRPLLAGSGGLVLVTSRNQLRGLASREGAIRLAVDEMPEQEAVRLLSSRLGRAESPPDLVALADLCGRLPVALSIAAERAERQDSFPLADLVAQLRDRQRRLDMLTGEDDDPLTSVRAVFEWSYRMLDDDTARLFRLLGSYGDTRIDARAVAALVGYDARHTAMLLDRLTSCHLLSHVVGDWYELHDLVSDYARELVTSGDVEERTAATRRLRSWLLHSAMAASEALTEPLTSIQLPAVEPGVDPEQFETASGPHRWFEKHVSHLSAVLSTSVAEDDATGYLLVPKLFAYLGHVARLEEYAWLFVSAEASAARLGDLEGQALCANTVAGVHNARGDSARAIEWVERSRDLFATAGSVRGRLLAQSNLAIALTDVGRLEDAAGAHRQAVEDARTLAVPARLGLSLSNASDFYLRTGDLDRALSTGEESVAVLAAVHEPHRRAAAQDNLGEVLSACGRVQEALPHFEAAAETFREERHRAREADTVCKLGIALRELGRAEEALAAWSRTRILLAELGVTDTGKVSFAELDELVASVEECSPP